MKDVVLKFLTATFYQISHYFPSYVIDTCIEVCFHTQLHIFTLYYFLLQDAPKARWTATGFSKPTSDLA